MPRKKGEWPVIGIDFGTTNSCVAVWREGHVEIIPNELGKRTTPSCVAFTDYDRLFGEAAINQASRNLVNTVFDAKGLIGRRFSDNNIQEDIKKRWPFKVIDGIVSGKEDQPMIVVKYKGEEKILTPEEVSAMTLRKMKGVAEAFLGGTTVNNAVISVPAHFNNSQRQATKDAGAIAGLNVMCIINEPTAAAIAYGMDVEINRIGDAKKNVLVCDLGGGTFDVSLIEIGKDGVRVKSTIGDSHLGGSDFDNRMVSEFVKQFKETHKKDISDNKRALRRLRVASEKAKRELSLIPQAEVEIDCLFEGIDFSSIITRAQFEDLNKDLFQKCMDGVEQCLKDAFISKNDVHDVVLTGGSSRIPKVQQLLKGYFGGKELCKSIHPDEAVAYGAAMHAAILSGVATRNKDFGLEDVTPLSIRVTAPDDTRNFFIRKNTTIPIQVNHPYKPDTTTLSVYEVEGTHEEEGENNNSTGDFHGGGKHNHSRLVSIAKGVWYSVTDIFEHIPSCFSGGFHKGSGGSEKEEDNVNSGDMMDVDKCGRDGEIVWETIYPSSDNEKILRENHFPPSSSPPSPLLPFLKNDSNLVGIFSLAGCSRRTPQVAVCFDIDVNGILNVSASEFTIRGTNPLTVKKQNGRLSKEEIQRMIEEAKRYQAQDEDRKKLLQAKSNLESYANTIQERLNDAGNIQNSKKETIRENLGTTFQWLKVSSNVSEISMFEEKLRNLKSVVDN